MIGLVLFVGRIAVHLSMQNVLRRDNMQKGVDKEHVPRLSTPRCKTCEYRQVESVEGHRRHYCMFWDNWLTEIKWCNK
jgi:hypothetical protein